MSCKQTEVELLPITIYEVKNIHEKDYELDSKVSPQHDIEFIKDKEYEFMFCVSYRDPSLPEWILARWWWNDQWIWTPDWVWHDQ